MRKLLIVVAGCGSLLAGPAYAAGEGCSDFLWPLATELSWMKAPRQREGDLRRDHSCPAEGQGDRTLLATGRGSVPSDKADQHAEAGGRVDPRRLCRYLCDRAGSLSGFDLEPRVDGCRAERQTARCDRSYGCEELRRTAQKRPLRDRRRPVTLQINNAPKDSIRIAIRPAAD